MTEGFCTLCGCQIESFDNLECCPNCKTQSLPCSWDNQVNISINWHELRLIFMWAEKWGMKHCDGAGVVYSIADRIRNQYPNKSSLTFADEIEELKKMFGRDNVQTNFPGIE
jgi:hypothetical protein